MFGLRKPDQAEAAARVRAWTRERFALPEDSAVMAAELRCSIPGCPPVDTVIAFWDDAGRRYKWRIFKPLTEVSPDDLPPGWLKPGLLDEGDDGCSCCG